MSRMKRIHIAILAALLACPLYLGAIYLQEFLTVDAALDSGASFDYVAMKADHTANHPYIAFSKRHGTLIGMAGWSAVGALAYFFAAGCMWRKERSA